MKLVRFNEITAAAYSDYMLEWEKSGERIVPWVTSRTYEEFFRMMHYWEEQDSDQIRKRGLVPATLYFLTEDSGRIIGAIHFRHELNDELRMDGGHIGYGIRPSEREKGHGRRMLGMMIQELMKGDLREVMLSCDDSNHGSVKVIEANGGFLENLVMCHDRLVRRYWIPLAGAQDHFSILQGEKQ